MDFPDPITVTSVISGLSGAWRARQSGIPTALAVGRAGWLVLHAFIARIAGRGGALAAPLFLAMTTAVLLAVGCVP
jgi:hypothetical protein